MQLPLRYRFLQFLIGIRDWTVAQLIRLFLWIIRLIPLRATRARQPGAKLHRSDRTAYGGCALPTCLA